MLDAFRQKGLSSAVYGILIVATVVIFVVQFRPDAGRSSGSLRRTCAAEVRGKCIDPKDFYAELMLLAPGRVDPAQMRALGLRKVALDGIIERELLDDDADRLGIAIAENDLDDELAAGRAHVSVPIEDARQYAYMLRLGEDMVRVLPVLNPDSKTFDYKVYDRVVRQFTNRSPTEFKEMQRRELLAARMRDLVRARVRVSDEEAFDAFSHEKSSVVIRYVKLRRDWFVAHALDLSPEAIDKWDKAHEEQVTKSFEAKKSQYLPECRSARHILVKVSESATDQEKAEARSRIEAALERVKKGESFEKVAREVSEDTSAAEGGDLGCFQKGRMVKPFEEAVFALKPGEISPIVETQFGFHVIKLEGVYKDKDAEAIGRRETAKALMIGEEGDRLAAETGKQILASVKAGKKLDEALSEALASVDAAEARRAATAKQHGGAVLPAAAKAGGDVATSDEGVVGAARPKVEISAPFNRGGDPISGAAPGQNVAEIAFGLAKEGDTPDDLVRLSDGYAVVQLKEKDIATREQFEKERETFIPAMLRAKQADALASYVARLRESAKNDIKVNESYARPPEKSPGEGDEE